MLKKYEVETIIRDALLELDGVLSDKPNEDGTYKSIRDALPTYPLNTPNY